MKDIGEWIAIVFVLVCLMGGLMRVLDFFRDLYPATQNYIEAKARADSLERE